MPRLRFASGCVPFVIVLLAASPAWAHPIEADDVADAESAFQANADDELGVPPGENGNDVNDVADEIMPDEDAPEEAAPARRDDDAMRTRWSRVGGPYFNRAPVNSYASGMFRWSGQFSAPSFGQFSIEGWAEYAIPDLTDYPLSLVAHWGLSLGYARAGSARFLQVVQPLYIGAKMNVLQEEDYLVSVMTVIGFIDDTVGGEYNPMNLLPGLGDFYWGISGMFAYWLPNTDFAFNVEAVLQFNFGLTGNQVSFSTLLEVVYLATDELALRGGFDFHTVASGANIFLQGDYMMMEDLLAFFQFKGFLSGSGRAFDIALMAGVTYYFQT